VQAIQPASGPLKRPQLVVAYGNTAGRSRTHNVRLSLIAGIALAPNRLKIVNARARAVPDLTRPDVHWLASRFRSSVRAEQSSSPAHGGVTVTGDRAGHAGNITDATTGARVRFAC